MDRGAWWATVSGVAKSQSQLGTALYLMDLGIDDCSKIHPGFVTANLIGFPDHISS